MCKYYTILYKGVSPLMAQMVKNLPAMQADFLGQADPLEKGVSSYSSILAWRIPWTEEPGRLEAMGSESRTQLSGLTCSLLSVFGFGYPWGSWDQSPSDTKGWLYSQVSLPPGTPVYHIIPLPKNEAFMWLIYWNNPGFWSLKEMVKA